MNVPIPQKFRDSIYLPEQIWQRLRWSEERFWQAVLHRELPAGVVFPMADGSTLLCWHRELIHAWIDAGMPMDQQASEHQSLLLWLFAVSFEDEFGTDAIDQVIESAQLTDRQRATLASHGVPVPAGHPDRN